MRVPVDADPSGQDAPDARNESEPDVSGDSERTGPRRPAAVEIEIERERTKRHLIEAITQVVIVVLYMAFTLIRERDSGVVVLDGDGDDWKE